MNWFIVFESIGLVFALAAVIFSIYIMASIKRGASIWIYLGITSFSMFFAMLLGVLGFLFPVRHEIQRLEQYIFLLAGAFSFALAGIRLHEMFELE